MRLPSTIFTLLIFTTALTAQTSTSGNSKAQFVPHADAAGQSCPVRFSVDRQPQGAVAFVDSLGSWSRRYGDHTLMQQQQILRAEPGFGKLTPQEQQEKLDQLTALYRSDPGYHTQGLGVTVVDAKDHIVATDIVVHGYPAGTRVTPASAPSREIAEDFHLAATEGLPLIDSPVRTTHIAIVEWLELTRIEYADGTSWQPSAASHCSASPSLFVLVNATAR
jgi:hypothetical protein